MNEELYKKERVRPQYAAIAVGLSIILIAAYIAIQNIPTKAKMIDEYMTAVTRNGDFSGTILVADRGKLIIKKGYGMADYEWEIPNSPDTRFNIGSLTKQFTAAAILQLQEKGIISINDYVSEYIPDFPNGNKITIHHLLTHTSGLPSYENLPDFQTFAVKPTSAEGLVEFAKGHPLEFDPGTKFAYSNTGYAVLGLIIEKVSGQSYGEYLEKNILRPLFMYNTGFATNDTVIPKHASGYNKTGSTRKNAPYSHMSVAYSAAGLYSTVEDLYLWDRFLYMEKPIDKASIDAMYTPGKGKYGYGWYVDKIFNRNAVYHRGGLDGIASYIIRFVDEKTCIIVLSNYQEAPVNQYGKDIAAILFGEKYEDPSIIKDIKVEPEILDKYLGKYQYNSISLTFKRDGESFYVLVNEKGRIELYARSETNFYAKVMDADANFVRDENGVITGVMVREGDKTTFARKIE